jgi:hypothetical protein
MQLNPASYYFFLLLLQYSLHQPTIEGFLCIFFANARDQFARRYTTAVNSTILHISSFPFCTTCIHGRRQAQNQLINIREISFPLNLCTAKLCFDVLLRLNNDAHLSIFVTDLI